MAANSLRGEVDFAAGDKSYVLRLGPASALLIQKAFSGTSLTKVVQERFGDPNNIDFEDVVTVMWAAMQRKGEGPSRDDVVTILDEVSIRECVEKISALFVATFGASEAAPAQNPPAASRTSTGVN